MCKDGDSMDIDHNQLKRRLLSRDTLLMFGPAWLVMMADMDASSYIGAAETGAVFGYGLIWLMLILIIPLYIIQELAGRISISTNDGLGNVIRKNYGKRIAAIASFPMAITDMVTYAIEYLGVAIGLEIMGIPIILSIPVIYVIHILIVTKRKYSQAEKSLILISMILIIALLISLFMRGFISVSSPIGNPVLIENTPTFYFLLAANTGAVIMPFMIFFQASATGRKSAELSENGINIPKKRKLNIMRKETFVGAIVTELMMVIAEMAFTGIKGASHSSFFATPEELSKVLTPIAGSASPYIFGIGLIAAGFIALIIISMGSAWGVAESLNLKKNSYWVLYVLESLPAVVAVILINPVMLVRLVLYLLVFFVLALIFPLIILWFIGKNEKIMGDLVLSGKESKLFIAISCFIVSTAVISVIV